MMLLKMFKNKSNRSLTPLSVTLVFLLSACGSDDRTLSETADSVNASVDPVTTPAAPANPTPDPVEPAAPVTQPEDPAELAPVDPPTPAANPGDPVSISTIADGDSSSEGFQIQLSSGQFNATEGGGPATIALTAVRLNGHAAPINLAISGDTLSERQFAR